jgi:hypothetical protein
MIPEPDYSQIQQADIRQTYWLLFQEIMKDFVHVKDLEIALAGNNVATIVTGSLVGATAVEGTGQGQAYFQLKNTVAKVKAEEYKAKAETGEAIREGIVAEAETALLAGS